MGSEVETILNEIRERVRATEQERAGVSVTIRDPDTAPTANGNSPQDEALARVSAHLTTTARAWDRLPPVFSNRSGASARLELWIKARLKTLSRWFTWEQINFNAAVHHALSETLEALSAHEKQLRALRSELNQDEERRRSALEKNEREVQAMRDEIESLVSESRRRAAKHSADLERQSAAAETRARETKAALEEVTRRLAELVETSGRLSQQSTEMATRFAEQTADLDARLLEQGIDVDARLAKHATVMAEQAAEISSRLSGLATEISQVSNDLREEQRVCFKQLSIEASEAAVLEDRGRRAIESRLEKLEKRNSGRQ
jgi:chromosome segregation ATPase